MTVDEAMMLVSAAIHDALEEDFHVIADIFCVCKRDECGRVTGVSLMYKDQDWPILEWNQGRMSDTEAFFCIMRRMMRVGFISMVLKKIRRYERVPDNC